MAVSLSRLVDRRWPDEPNALLDPNCTARFVEPGRLIVTDPALGLAPGTPAAEAVRGWLLASGREA